jgi:hypothetical protein
MQVRGLARIVADQGQNWRLRRGSSDGFFELVDAATKEPLTDDISETDVRNLCAGVIGLASLRRSPKP